MYCKNCGAQIDDNSRFCSHCGARQGLLDGPGDAPGPGGAPGREEALGPEGAPGREEVPGPGDTPSKDSPDSPEPKPAQRSGGKFPVWILCAILFLVGIMLMAVVIPSALMALTGSAG